ncbi:hypothetical protein, partial [Klebsiella pneumoniae]|uniref:hypothetical protein n=1 Tax=Klebsiella pneumoniae TaxID=573 RepID=UPI0027309096
LCCFGSLSSQTLFFGLHFRLRLRRPLSCRQALGLGGNFCSLPSSFFRLTSLCFSFLLTRNFTCLSSRLLFCLERHLCS